MKSLRDALRTPALGALVVMSFLHVLSFTQLESTFALHLCARLGFGMRETGFAFALIGLVVAVVQGGVLGRVARKYGETALVRTGLTLLVAGHGAHGDAARGARREPLVREAASRWPRWSRGAPCSSRPSR